MMDQVTASSTRQLEAAFEVFNRMSDSLGESYKELESKVSELSHELANERSERYKELAAKEALANRLSRLLSVLPGGVIVLDSVDRISEANPEAMELLGEDILGQSWAVVMETRVQPKSAREKDVQLANGRFVSISERVLDAEANQVILLTDVTEAHELQEWVSRETRLSALGEMSARLAHQLRTPLSSALLYASQLSLRTRSNIDHEKIGAKITNRLNHIEMLIEGMLGYVRGDKRTQSRYSLSELVHELKLVIAGKAESKGGHVALCCSFNDVIISGDRDALLSALINIAENAIDLIDVPRLEIHVSVEDAWVRFSVRDNGPGIDPSVISNIFDPFYTTRVGGTGLGLAIADMTAREHGGYITAGNLETGGAVFDMHILNESFNPTGSRLPAAVSEKYLGEKV